MTKPKLGNFRTQRLNANKHTPRGLGMLADSIGQDGWIGAMTVAADGETFDGSARLEVLADAMPSAEPIVVDSDGTRPVIVRRTDIASTDDPRAKRLGLGANRIAQVDLDWDADALAALAGDVDLSKLWNKDELADLLKGLGGNDAEDPGAQVDKAAELQAKWGTALGQLWAIGRHRLLVGDCTVAENVARLMGGEKAGAVVTDPPYAILGGGQSVAGAGIESAFDRQFFRAWFSAFLNVISPIMDDGAAQWMTIDWRGATAIDEAVVGTRWKLAGVGVWYRGGLGMGFALRKTYENFVLLTSDGWERTKTDEPDVWDHQWTPGDRHEGHAAEKPVELMTRALELVGGDIVLDPFTGSGTTLVACEKLGRIGRGMELSPAYAAVTLERLSGLGLVPELIA